MHLTPPLNELEIERPLSPVELHDAYLTMQKESFQRALRFFQPYRDALQGWYDLWRGYWKATSDPGWNNVHIPLLFSIVLSDVARVQGQLFGGESPLQFIPQGGEDFGTSRVAERLIDAQMYNSNLFVKTTRFLMRANIYGSAIMRLGWKTQYGPVLRERAVDTGRAVELPGGVPNVLKFNGPDCQPIANENFLPSPGYQEIDEMPGVHHIFYKEFEDILINSSDEQTGHRPIYDAAVVERMRVGERGPGRHIEGETRARRSLESTDDVTRGMLQQMRRPVKIVESFMRVPREFGAWYNFRNGTMSRTDPGDRQSKFITDFVITVANEAHVLRAVPIWTLDQRKPFLKHSPFEDPEVFWAPGKIEIGAKAQVAINRLANNQLDAYDRWIDPPWVVNINSAIVPGSLSSGPGARIFTQGKTDEGDLRQLSPEMKWVSNTYTEIGQLWRWMQQATGITEDIGQGLRVGGRQSATEFAGRSEAVNTRISLETMLAEKQYLERMGQGYWDLNRQYLDTPHLLRQIGSHAVMDPVTGRFRPPVLDVISDLNLARSFDIRATGATRQLSKSARQQSLAAFMPALVPFLPAINLRAFMRQILPIMDFNNVDELINSEQEMLQALTLGVGGINGASGTNGANAGSGPQAQGIAANDPLGNIRAILQQTEPVSP